MVEGSSNEVLTRDGSRGIKGPEYSWVTLDIVNSSRSDEGQPYESDRGKHTSNLTRAEALYEEESSKYCLEDICQYLVDMPRVTRVKKRTTEMEVIWLMMLGFATARPPTADVTETAESWDEYSSKISERTGGGRWYTHLE